MGNCRSSSPVVVEPPILDGAGPSDLNDTPFPDPFVYDLIRRNPHHSHGQFHLLYKKGKPLTPMEVRNSPTSFLNKTAARQSKVETSTRLVWRKLESSQQAPLSQTHVYAIRSLETLEQRPPDPPLWLNRSKVDVDLTVDLYQPAAMAVPPAVPVHDWVCVSDELDIYICDTGLTSEECDALVQTTEQVCRGQYAAYTYAKQTLGCREFPQLANQAWDAVHRVIHCIWSRFPSSRNLQLDDREPHMVKYDVTKKERQKLDMHTDKSEWTFLIALSDGCGLDYEGGGTYFEALDATIHVQRGHALIFPGRLRHCGQRITKGLRFLLVGFLVDKTTPGTPQILNGSGGQLTTTDQNVSEA